MSCDVMFTLGDTDESLVDEVINFCLASEQIKSVLFEKLYRWIGREVVATIEGCVKIRGILEKVEYKKERKIVVSGIEMKISAIEKIERKIVVSGIEMEISAIERIEKILKLESHPISVY